MDYGFVKIASVTPYVKISDCFYNAEIIAKNIKKVCDKNVKLVAFPELSITGYSCSDLFLQDSLLQDSKEALRYILDETKNLNITCVVGMPLDVLGKLYNCGVCFYKGEILGIVPKTYIPNYNEFYEKRHFNAFEEDEIIQIYDEVLSDKPINFGKIIFDVKNIKYMKFSVEICEDLWAVISPSANYCLSGANIIVNLSASNETVGKSEYRRELVKSQSARCICAYLYCSAGEGESTTDLVFSGHNIIAENGAILKESKKFENGIIYGDVDLQYINSERRRNSTFLYKYTKNIVSYDMEKAENTEYRLDRYVDKAPFVPKNDEDIDHRCNEILDIQCYGLKKRIEHIGIKNVVIGISGGLDSTQALISTVRCYDILKYDRKNIICATMPCFGTTNKTYENAKALCYELGVTLIDINIKDAVLKHFMDISHDKDVQDVVYENTQARERTQILMSLANKYKAIVVGTGDLSELALGFATYNGDHMSMYGINSSIPKTLIKYIINHFAKTSEKGLKKILENVLNTPVSPELLPPKDEKISQITEDIVGPYELHDFFLYHMLRNGFEPEKIYYLTKIAFENVYTNKIILKWLEKFYIRFFSAQFKRSCMPDGVKIGISLSPRGDFRMPSDASVCGIIKRIEKIKKNEKNEK